MRNWYRYTREGNLLTPKAFTMEAESDVIVGIGSSAGGLSSLRELLSSVDSCTHSYVLVSHLGSESESQLVKTLQAHSKVPVKWAEEGMSPVPGALLVAPPGHTVIFERGLVKLESTGEGEIFPIDRFFQSLGETFHSRAVAVVLTGGGSDGSNGVRCVKDHQGLVIVESPEGCQHPDMPRNAISTGVVDEILPPKSIPSIIELYRLHIPGEEYSEEQEDRLRPVLEYLREQTGHDFTGYKTATIARRLDRRMGLLSTKSLATYLSCLRQDDLEAQKLVQQLRIGVTGFFRDSEVWKEFAETVVPELLANHEPQSMIRVWVPACSTGEEAYTLACILALALEEAERPLNFQIFATDVEENALSLGREGDYPGNFLSDVPKPYLKYFEKRDGDVRVNESIRDRTLFSCHDLLRDPPFSKLDVISCRNLLIYLKKDAQMKVLNLLHYGLKDDGILVLGSSESPGDSSELFSPVVAKQRLYRKKKTKRRALPRFRPYVPFASGEDFQRSHSAGHPFFDELLSDALVRAFAPATVLLNENFRIVYHLGETDLFLTPPSGSPTNVLFNLLRPGLAPTVRDVLDKVKEQGTKISKQPGRLKKGDTLIRVSLSVIPMEVGQGAERFFALTVEPEAQVEVSDSLDVSEEHGRLVKQLSDELTYTRGELEQALDQSTATYDALRASNEEMLSMNEELQVSNEELETHKEELQALNEELSTVNTELRNNVNRLEAANNDLSNFVSGTDIATLFLDADLCIRMFTPAVEAIYALSDGDIGRELSVFSSTVEDPTLFDEARSVLNDLQRREKEVEGKRDTWYLRRLSPYRTKEGHVEGVVLTYSDITELVRARDALSRQAQELEELVQYRTRELNTLLENAPDVIARFDRGLRHVYVNSKAQEITGLPREEMIGKTNRELGFPNPLVEMWARHMERCFETGVPEDFYFDLEGRSYQTKVVPERHGDDTVETLLCMTRDLTRLRKAEITRDKSEKRLTATFEQAVVGFAHLTPAGVCLRSNPRMCDMLRCSEEQLVGKKLEDGFHHNDRELFVAGVENVGAGTEQRFCAELRWRVEKDSYQWFRLTLSLVANEIEDEPYLFVVAEDIRARRQAELESEALKDKLARGQRLEQLGLMAGGVAHDFNNLLVGIVGSASLALERLPEESEASRDISMVLEAGRRAGELARQMLAYAGRATVELVAVDPSVAVEELLPLLNCLPQNGSTIESDLDNISRPVRLDTTQLHEALANLVVNASESYGEEGGVITVRVTEQFLGELDTESFQVTAKPFRPGVYVLLELADTGSGIEEEVVHKVFDPFFSTKADGRGLGLPMIAGFTKAHGGHLRLNSQIGEGTSFQIYLPTLDEPVPKAEMQLKSVEVKRTFSGRVLVVDDEKLVRVLLRRSLERMGLEVETARSGRNALEKVDANSFELVVLDLNMPDMSGAEVLRTIRETDSEIPIVISSGYDREEVLQHLPRSQKVAFLPKPYSQQQLHTILNRFLNT